MQPLRWVWAVLCAALLVGCGGGGGGGDASAARAALSFNPSSVTTNVEVGTSATLTVRATASDASQFNSTVYVYVVDTAQVLSGEVQISAIDASTFAATLHTRPGLPLGRYQGSFQVKLCKDSACTGQFSGSPLALPYDITVVNAPLRASPSSAALTSVHRGETVGTLSSFQVSVQGIGWTAQAADAWLQVVNGSGTGDGSFQLRYLTSGLAEGNHASSVTVTGADGQSVKLPIAITVLPVSFVVTSGVPSFTAVNGAPVTAMPLSFALDNQVASNWTARSLANWLLVSPTSGVTPSTVMLQPDAARAGLASGSYTGDVVLSSTGVADKSVTAQLKLTTPTLSSSALSVTLGGSSGHDFAPQKLAIALNTGSNAWPFTLSGLPTWLSSSAASGTVGQSGAELSFTADVSKLSAGSSATTVTAKAVVNGDSVSLPLTINVNADQRRLLASEWGVALASSPVGTSLTRSIRISDNYGGALNWTASSDVAWLTVSGSGSTGGQLAMTANAAGLPDNEVSYANVTLASATPNVQGAVIRVALWKSSGAALAMTTVSAPYRHMVADRIRPYVYANNGGAAIDVFNAYSGQKVRSLAGVGAALGQMTVSLDGSRLYVLDTAASKMQVVDLVTMSVVEGWNLDRAVSHSTGLIAARPNGTEVVLVGDGSAYGDKGVKLASNGVSGDHLETTLDGQSIVNLGARYSVDYSTLSGGMYFSKVAAFLDSNSRGNLRAVAVSPDGSRIYTASGGGVQDAGYRCGISNGVTGAYIGALPGGDAYPTAVNVTRDGRVLCGVDIGSSSADVWLHASSGALIRGYKTAMGGPRTNGLMSTPDGFVVVANGSSDIAFIPIGP